MKWKKTAYDCPFCDYCLSIYTDKNGNVKRVIRGEGSLVAWDKSKPKNI